MIYIAVIAVIGILFLQGSGAIPEGSVGGSMVMGFVLLLIAPFVGMHEAWTMKRGVVGWIVNILVALLGAFLVAPLGGGVLVMIISTLFDVRGSIASTGGGAMTASLIGMVGVIMAGAWAAIWIVNRWRDRPKPQSVSADKNSV